VTCALGTDVGGGLGFGLLKEGLHAYLMQRLAPEPAELDPARLLYLATRAGAEALGLESHTGDFKAGKAADFVHLRPPAGSVLEASIRHAPDLRQALAALFTLGGSESVREVRVEGSVVFSQG
jgi:guanine deaminase